VVRVVRVWPFRWVDWVVERFRVVEVRPERFWRVMPEVPPPRTTPGGGGGMLGVVNAVVEVVEDEAGDPLCTAFQIEAIWSAR
jgi:hypothetical protein